MTIERVWEVTVSLQRTITMPIEEHEDKDEARAWLRTPEGKKYLLDKVIAYPRIIGLGRNTDLYVDDIELKEYEVSKHDTDLRV